MEYYLEDGHINSNFIGCLFESHILFYTILLLLVLGVLIYSAWKAPKWVRPAGRIALSLVLLKGLTTVTHFIDLHMYVGSDPWRTVYGLRVWYPFTTVAILGLSIYLLSVIVNIVRTPRI